MATNTNEVWFKLTELSGKRVMRSSSNYFFHEFQMALDLAASDRLQLKPLITHYFHLNEVKKAFEILVNKERYQALKVIIVY